MPKILADLTKGILMSEPWGKDNKILQTYIYTNFEIAYMQKKVFEDKEKGIAFWKIGSLVTMSAMPVWFIYKINDKPDCQFWNFDRFYYGNNSPAGNKTADDYQIEYETPAFYSSWLIELTPETINHIIKDNSSRLKAIFGDKLSENEHMLLRTIFGELELQKRKSDVFMEWYDGKYQFLMPLYFTDPDNVDLTATLDPQEATQSYKVRTLLYPEYAYPFVRSVIKNRSVLTGWMNFKDDILNETELEDGNNF